MESNGSARRNNHNVKRVAMLHEGKLHVGIPVGILLMPSVVVCKELQEGHILIVLVVLDEV